MVLHPNKQSEKRIQSPNITEHHANTSDIDISLKEKIEFLYKVARLYEDLVKKTKGHYNWRLEAIRTQIDALEELRDNKKDNWLECYAEDLAESKL